MKVCELCEKDSGRIDLRNRCCKVRFVSKMPKEKRQAYYERVRIDEGEQAMRVLIDEVNKEFRRRAGNHGGSEE